MAAEQKVRDALDAAKGLVEAVPVYQDLVQPAARELGQAAAGAIRAGLAPITALVWGYDKIKDFLERELEERTSHLSQEQMQPPNPRIAGPAIEALRFAASTQEIRELFVNLIASSMDKDSAHKAHPAFVDIINQLTPDEARILSYFQTKRSGPLKDFSMPVIDVVWFTQDNINQARPKKLPGSLPGVEKLVEQMAAKSTLIRNFCLAAEHAGCEHPDLCTEYLDNLARLGVIRYINKRLADDSVYEELEHHSTITSIEEAASSNADVHIRKQRHLFELTDFGKQLCDVCTDNLADKELCK